MAKSKSGGARTQGVKDQSKGLTLPLPLEYCRIDRAARLLGCEVEDIVHWGAIGAIDLCVNLNFIPCRLGMMIRLSDGPEENAPPDDLTEAEFTRWNSVIDLLEEGGTLGDYSSFHAQHIREGDDNGFHRYPDGGVEFVRLGRAKGFWRLARWNCEHLEVHGSWQKHSADGEITRGIMLRPINHKKDLALATISIPYGKESLGVSELWVLRPDLEKLYRAITDGESLLNIHNNAELAQRAEEQDKAQVARTAPVHGNSENNAVNRQAILMAAIACKENWPDLCENSAQWAETIEQKALLFWPKTGSPPRARSGIETLLRKAKKLDPL